MKKDKLVNDINSEFILIWGCWKREICRMCICIWFILCVKEKKRKVFYEIKKIKALSQ